MRFFLRLRRMRNPANDALNRAEIVEALHFQQLAVDRQSLVTILDSISRQSDDALDIVRGRIQRIAEHDHVAALRLTRINNFRVQDRQPDTVA